MDGSSSVQGVPDRSEARTDDTISETSTPAPAQTSDAGPGSSSLPGALARFEFEKDKANEGTKILMVEWEPCPPHSNLPPQHRGNWEVEFEGKEASFPLTEEDRDGTQRIYFLIAPQISIPPEVTISQPDTGYKMTTKCMPAIFAPGLGVDSRDAGKRGVLHTIWAKTRFSQLQEEIRKELQDNSEGIGLEMAIQERQWLVDHFGLEAPEPGERPAPLAPAAPQPSTPQSPRSPIGGRLGERLKGLRLATSPTDLASKPGKSDAEDYIHLT